MQNHTLSSHTPQRKPLELYMFVDPLCSDCWGLEPIVKKLIIEYGRFFSLRHIVSGKLETLQLRRKKSHENMAMVWERAASRSGMSCDGTIWMEDPISTPYAVSVAIKAAELQGRKSGNRFLRKVQEVLFLEKQNISNEEVLIECAKDVGLDVDEFIKDIHSPSAARALQCDLKITSEMDVQEIPTLILFNEHVEDEGLKISGCYSYDVYVQVIQDMLGRKVQADPVPPLEVFLQHFRFVATKEISVVYDMSCNDVEREMKKLALQKKVERVPVKYGTFWRYIQ
ncbi:MULTISPECIES: ClpXP adapter SpxH family protein [Bacillaceae]|uniref:ClpXP adapter SpxH family protein n=1 Tax=Bacillaceae TaxID=186817 RepID=UPI001BDEA375|nr:MULTISPECIES: ClpXP adapter SpxH family protein [Bacillaceae]MDX8362552.1 ClpXP adapter SpxH family protein [Cytobacillus sp. IB215316]